MNISFPKPGETGLLSASVTTAATTPSKPLLALNSTSSTTGSPASITATTITPTTTITTTSTTTTTTTTTTIPTTTSTASASVTTTTANLLHKNGAPKTNLPASVTFAQLEENINKWTIELEEQEKVFMNQVAHINEWDRLLLANGDKIVSLNSSVEKVKLEQQQLDHELDFIVAQQRELEECLLPLEKDLADVNVSDPERDATYRMAESLKSQLRQMSEDLKEVIEHINEKNKHQDSSDPIVQIGRILNAHMNSLQWVDQNTALIKQQLDQVTKLSEMHRRENGTAQSL